MLFFQRTLKLKASSQVGFLQIKNLPLKAPPQSSHSLIKRELKINNWVKQFAPRHQLCDESSPSCWAHFLLHGDRSTPISPDPFFRRCADDDQSTIRTAVASEPLSFPPPRDREQFSPSFCCSALKRKPLISAPTGIFAQGRAANSLNIGCNQYPGISAWLRRSFSNMQVRTIQQRRSDFFRSSDQSLGVRLDREKGLAVFLQRPR